MKDLDPDIWRPLQEYFNTEDRFFKCLSDVYEAYSGDHSLQEIEATRIKRGVQGSLEAAWDWVIDNAPGKTNWLKCGAAE